jgi:hypothetical protein
MTTQTWLELYLEMVPKSNGKTLPFTELDLAKGEFRSLRDRLTFTVQSKSVSDKPIIIGLDTETYTDASLLCITDSDGRVLEGNRTIPEIFNWLSSHNRSTYFVWNLSFDAMILLKGAPTEILKEAYWHEKNQDTEESSFVFNMNGIKIKYLYKKALELSNEHKTVRIYDAAQLYGKISLQAAAEKFLGKGKKEVGSKRFEKGLSRERLREIMDYSIEDSKLAQQLAEKWIVTFAGEFGYYPARYYSAGAIITEYLYRTLPRFPTFTIAPYKIQEMAYRGYYGGRFEIFQRGTFKEVWKYDINSAYPFAITQMPDFTNGTWTEIDETQIGAIWKVNPKTAGFFEIEANIPKDQEIGPFMFRIGNKVLNPVGRFRTVTTLSELVHVPYEWFRINRGFIFEPNSLDNPLADLMRSLYTVRLTKEEPQRTVYKILMNSVYGKTAQVKPRVGQLFSPIVAAYITGFTRALLLKASLGKPGLPIAFATDAIFSKIPLENLEIGPNMGQWTAEKHESLTLFMNGVYFLGKKAKTRGFSPKVIVDNRQVELTLDLVNRYLVNGKVNLTLIKPNPFKDSLRRGRNPGEFTENTREIDLNADSKRIWLTPLVSLEANQISKPFTFVG